MAPKKNTKSVKEGINGKLALTIKSGKYHLGYKSVLKTLRSGKGKFHGESSMSLRARSLVCELLHLVVPPYLSRIMHKHNLLSRCHNSRM